MFQKNVGGKKKKLVKRKTPRSKAKDGTTLDKTADIFESSETLYAVCSSLKYNFNVVFTIIFHSFLSQVRLLRGSLTPPIFITWLTPDSQVSVNQEPSYWGSGKEVESNRSVKRTVWLKTRTFPFRIFVSCGEFVENSLILIVRK